MTQPKYIPDGMTAVTPHLVGMPVQDMFWGDRYGHIVDPFGHSWSVATHLRDLSPQEIQKAMLLQCGAMA